MRVCKSWQNFHFWITNPFNGCVYNNINNVSMMHNIRERALSDTVWKWIQKNPWIVWINVVWWVKTKWQELPRETADEYDVQMLLKDLPSISSAAAHLIHLVHIAESIKDVKALPIPFSFLLSLSFLTVPRIPFAAPESSRYLKQIAWRKLHPSWS